MIFLREQFNKWWDNISAAISTKHSLAITLLIFFYTLSFGVMLLNPSVYWDDWTLILNDQAELVDTFKQAGAPWGWTGFLHYNLIKLKYGIEIYRILNFFSYLISGLCVYFCLIKLNIFERRSSFIISLLFLIIPINHARIALINLPYALCFFSFYLALTLNLYLKKNLINEILITLFFLFSFITASLLPYFYPLILISIFFNEAQRDKLLFLNSIKKSWRLLISPFYFFFIKSYFFPSSGLYKDYNLIDFSNILISIKKLPKLIFNSYTGGSGELKLIISIIFGTFIILTAKRLISKSIEAKSYASVIVCAIFIFWFGVFPYILVGSTPESVGWESRHQLLMSLSLSLILLELINKIVSSELARRTILSIYVICCLGINIQTQFDLYYDGLMQRALIEQIKVNPTFNNHKTFSFNCDSKFWAINRKIRFYEFSGFFRKALNDQTRFGSCRSDIEIAKNKIYHSAKYNLAEYKYDTNILSLNLKSPLHLSNFDLVSFMINQIFDANTYNSKLLHLIDIQILRD